MPQGISMKEESNPPKIVDNINVIRLAPCINWETRADLIKKVLPSSITNVGAKILVRHPRIASAGLATLLYCKSFSIA